MLPVNPFPPLKLGKPLLFLGLAAGAAAVALWARRQAKGAGAPQKLIRVEPSEGIEQKVELPWGTEVR